MADLKPCPFCGSKLLSFTKDGTATILLCGDCSGMGPLGMDEETAAIAWNMRGPLRPLAEWHEDNGAALWWNFPIDEPPWCGQPIDDDWPHYHTHWTPLVLPDAPGVPPTNETKENEYDHMRAWVAEGEAIMQRIEAGRGGVLFGVAFGFGAWWADRPWRKCRCFDCARKGVL